MNDVDESFSVWLLRIRAPRGFRIRSGQTWRPIPLEERSQWIEQRIARFMKVIAPCLTPAMRLMDQNRMFLQFFVGGPDEDLLKLQERLGQGRTARKPLGQILSVRQNEADEIRKKLFGDCCQTAEPEPVLANTDSAN